MSQDTVRDILRNRTYLGKVKYQQYRRNADESRSYAAPIEWIEGQLSAKADIESVNQRAG